MEVQYFYVNDQVDNRQLEVEWNPGGENLGDYTSKHHKAKHQEMFDQFIYTKTACQEYSSKQWHLVRCKGELEIGPKASKHLCHNFQWETALDEARQQDAQLLDRRDLRAKCDPQGTEHDGHRISI